MLLNVKLEIKNENYISLRHIPLDELIFNGTTETNVAMMAILFCRDFVKLYFSATWFEKWKESIKLVLYEICTINCKKINS